MPWHDLVVLILTHVAIVVGFAIAIIFAAHIVRQRRNPSATLAWLLAVCLIPYVALPLYLLIGGRKRQRAQRLKGMLDKRPPEQDIQPVGPVQQVLHSFRCGPALPGHRIRLLHGGVATYEALTELIASATTSIHLATFVYSPDEVGRDIVKRLARKAAEGVEVRLLLDAIGARKTRKRHLRPLLDAGGQVARFMPLFRGYRPTRADLRNHRKILIVDGQRVMAGGTNIAREYIGPTPLPGRWKDLSFLLEGPNTAIYRWIFESDWAFANDVPGEQPIPEIVPPSTEDGASVQVVPSGPDVPSDPLYDAFVTAFYAARQRIWIVTPYFIPNESLLQGIAMAARRGVDVRILVPQKSNHGMTNLARGPYLRELRDAGATVLQYLPGMVHAKILVVDDQLAMVGSCNLDLRSLLLNYEVAMFAYTQPEIDAVVGWIESLTSDCEVGIKDAGAMRDLTESLAGLVAPLL